MRICENSVIEVHGDADILLTPGFSKHVVDGCPLLTLFYVCAVLALFMVMCWSSLRLCVLYV